MDGTTKFGESRLKSLFTYMLFGTDESRNKNICTWNNYTADLNISK